MSRKREDALLSAHAVLDALKSSIRVLRWGMLALVAVYLASGITVVKPSDAGLIVRLGRVLPEILQPGLRFAFPRPIDEVVLIPAKTVQEFALDEWTSNQVPTENVPASLNPISSPYTLTGDVNIVQARFTVRYQVSDPIAYAFSVRDRESLCKSIGYEAACEALAGMTVDDALTTKRDVFARRALFRAQREMDRLRLGIHLLAFETREINPPPQVLAAFQDVVSARVQARTLVEPANTNRALAIPAANSKAFALQRQAEADRQQAVAMAKGSSSSFLAILKEFNAEPQLVEARLYAETLSATLPLVHVSTVLPSGDETRLILAPKSGAQSGSSTGVNADNSSGGGSRKDISPAVLLPQPD